MTKNTDPGEGGNVELQRVLGNLMSGFLIPQQRSTATGVLAVSIIVEHRPCFSRDMHSPKKGW